MERRPLTGEIVFVSTEKAEFNGGLQYINSTDFSLVYKTEGIYNNKKISGIMIEFFPDDVADTYYDIARSSDNKIEIGKLSAKSFDNLKQKFRDYYETIAKETESDGFIFFEENNTFYVFINDDIKTEENMSPDILEFALLVCRSASAVSDYGYLINCREYVKGKSGKIIPAGPFILPDSDEDIVQKNILNFGRMFFRIIFGREASIFDRRFHAQIEKSETNLPENITDETFDVVCNIVRRTIQLNRDNCFSCFGDILKEFEKIF